jgi:hypothetical protein
MIHREVPHDGLVPGVAYATRALPDRPLMILVGVVIIMSAR